MTLHWWMHWFWVTAVAVVAVLASEAWCAPQSNHPVYAAVHSGSGPTGAAEYMALLSDLDHPPATGAQDYHAGFGEDEEDTYGGANLFPVHPRVVIAAPADYPTTYVPLVLAPQQPRHELPPTPRDQVVFVTDHSKPPSPTRLGKSVDEMTAAATLIPAMPVQYKNRNPFINEEMQSGRSVAAVVVPAVESLTTEAVPLASSTTGAPILEEKMASEDGLELVEASVAPAVHDQTSKSTEETNESTPRIAPTASSEGAAQTEEIKTTEPTQETVITDEGGTHPIPPWIPDEKQEELDSEEQEREHEQVDRITNALVEEESVDEGEAITRGRMQPNEGLGTPSIIAIVIAFVGIIGMAGAAAGFILYKRSLLNKPQTLNDKISNPDYSSYIDDTLRDNSEEMYSLDNDSFLNSLEAMTIQNFWTENVKHTKL